MSDELKIQVPVIMEADESASIKQIQSQIPSIEKGLKSSKIKVPVEVDASDVSRAAQESVKAATSSLKTGGKRQRVVIPVDAEVKLDPSNKEAFDTEVKRLVGLLTKNKGELIGFKIKADGVNDAKSVLLKYKNEAEETVSTLVKLKKASEQVALSKDTWEIDSTTLDKNIDKYKKNIDAITEAERKSSGKYWQGRFKESIPGIAGTNDELLRMREYYSDVADSASKAAAANDNATKAASSNADRLRQIQLDAKNLKTLQSKSGLSLDWGLFDKAVDIGDMKQAAVELGILQREFRNLNTAMSADMPNQAIENLPKKIQDAATSINVLAKQFDMLGARGAAIPDNVGGELATLAQELQKISSAPITEGSLKQFGDITQRVNALKNTLKEVGVAFRLENAEKGMDALGVNIQKTQQRLLNMKVTWSAFLKDPQLVASWNKLFDSSKVVQTTGDMRVLNAEIGLLEKQIQGKGLDQKSFIGRLGDNVKKFTSWFLIGGGVASAVRTLRDVVTAVKDVDRAMVQLRKVTNETDATYEKFLAGAGKKATELATSVSSYIDAVGRFAQMGFNLPDSESLARIASMYLNVGDGVGSMDESVASIISTIKSFGIEAQNSSRVIDVFNEVGNKFAVTSGDIGQAMQRAGSALATSNNSLEQSVALWTAMNEILQDGDVSATSLRFITQRMRNTAGQLQEMGEDADGAAESVTALQQKIKALTGVDLMASPTEFRDTYSVLQDISKVWNDITDKDRADVIRLLAGTRQSASFSALMSNFSTAEEALQVALESSGSAYRENLKWLDSIEAKQQQAKSAFQAFSVAILNSDLIKGAYDAGTGILGFLTTVTEQLGALPTLATAAAAALSFKNKGISNRICPIMP